MTAAQSQNTQAFGLNNDPTVRASNSDCSLSNIWDHVHFAPTRHIVDRPSSSWRSKLEARLNELTGLSKGWDGYQAEPVSFTCAEFAAKVLDSLCNERVPAPSLVPGADGTVQIEWHCNGFDIELDVLDVGMIEAYRLNVETGQEDEIEVGVDFTEIARWIKELANAQ